MFSVILKKVWPPLYIVYNIAIAGTCNKCELYVARTHLYNWLKYITSFVNNIHVYRPKKGLAMYIIIVQ